MALPRADEQWRNWRTSICTRIVLQIKKSFLLNFLFYISNSDEKVKGFFMPTTKCHPLHKRTSNTRPRLPTSNLPGHQMGRWTGPLHAPQLFEEVYRWRMGEMGQSPEVDDASCFRIHEPKCPKQKIISFCGFRHWGPWIISSISTSSNTWSSERLPSRSMNWWLWDGFRLNLKGPDVESMLESRNTV